MAYGPGPSTADILRQQQLNRERELAEANRLQPQPQQQTQPSAITKLPTNPNKNAAFAGLRQIDAGIQYDDKGRPIRNAYTSINDANGNLLSQFSMASKIGDDVNLNTQALNEMRSRALSQGPSAWANLALQQQGMQEQQALSQNNRMNQSNLNQGMRSLAGRGGMSQGQRERMAMQGMRQANLGGQGVLNQGMQNRMNINLQDQQSKDQMLQQLPGQEMNAANFAQSQRAYRNQAQAQDLSNSLRDIGGFNAYNADAYAKAMQEWGAAKTADAQAQASRGGGGKK